MQVDRIFRQGWNNCKTCEYIHATTFPSKHHHFPPVNNNPYQPTTHNNNPQQQPTTTTTTTTMTHVFRPNRLENLEVNKALRKLRGENGALGQALDDFRRDVRPARLLVVLWVLRQTTRAPSREL